MFHGLGTGFPSISSNLYTPTLANDITLYGHSQFSPSLPSFGFLVLVTTFRSTRSPTWKLLGLIFLSYLLFICCWYEANLIVAISLLSSSRLGSFRRLLSFSSVSNSVVRVVGRPTSSGMTASTP
jgi:hypothetical protein